MPGKEERKIVDFQIGLKGRAVRRGGGRRRRQGEGEYVREGEGEGNAQRRERAMCEMRRIDSTEMDRDT